MSLWLVIPIIIVVGWVVLTQVLRVASVRQRITQSGNVTKPLSISDADKAALFALLYQVKDLAYESETLVFSPEWEGAIKSIDELRYLWRFKDPVKWVSKEGFEHED